MSTIYTVHEAKTHLSRLLAQAERNEEIIIARADRPVARLVPIDSVERPPRVLGGLHGRGTIADEHWMADEIESLFGAS